MIKYQTRERIFNTTEVMYFSICNENNRRQDKQK